MVLIVTLSLIAGGLFFSSIAYANYSNGAWTNPTQTPPSGEPQFVIPIDQGGTSSTTAYGARQQLGAAESGANTSITSLAPSTGNPLSIGSAGLKFSDGTTQTTAAQSTQWTSSNGGIYYNGQIGVGTNSYFGYITTNGTQAFDGTGAVDILLNTSGAGWGDIQNDGNGIWSLGYSANSSATTTPLGTPILSWTRGGYVGIATTTPSSPLQIYTTSNASNASLNVTLSQSGTPTFDFLRAQNSGGSNAPLVDFSLEHSRVNEFEIWGQSGGSSYASRLAINLNSGQVGINESDPNLGGVVSSMFTVNATSADGTGLTLAYNGTPAFAVNPNSDGSWYMYDHQSGSWKEDIYATNGVVEFVNGATLPSTDLVETGTGLAAIVLDSAGADWGKIQNDAANTWSLSYTSSGGTTLGTPALTWTGNGNVGINNSSPFTPLFVDQGLVNGADAAVAAVGNGSTAFGADVSGSGGGHGLFGTNLYIDPSSNFRTLGTHTGGYGYAGMDATWGALNFYASGSLNTTAGAIVTPSPIMSITSSGVNVKTGGYAGLGKICGATGTQCLNFDNNGWLYMSDTSGNVYGGQGIAMNSLWAQSITLNGVARTEWPGSQATRQGFSSGSGSNFQSQYVTITSISFSLPDTATLSISAFVEDAYSTSYISAYSTNGSSCTSEITSSGNWPMDIGIELDGSTYAWASASGGSYTVNSSDIIPNVASGSHTLSLVSYNSSAPPNLTGCTAAADAWGIGALSYVAL